MVILADPDGHEICFVGEEGFRELSARDPQGPALLAAAMEKDTSGQWWAERVEYLKKLDEQEAKEAQAAAT